MRHPRPLHQSEVVPSHGHNKLVVGASKVAVERSRRVGIVAPPIRLSRRLWYHARVTEEVDLPEVIDCGQQRLVGRAVDCLHGGAVGCTAVDALAVVA